MADSSTNAATAASAYEAFKNGDAEALMEIFSECVWHVPGRNQIAGTMKGAAEIMPFFGKLAEITGGTFTAEVEQIFSDGDRVVTLHTTRGRRPDGETLESLGVLVWRFESGKVAEIHEMFFDQYAEDTFWA